MAIYLENAMVPLMLFRTDVQLKHIWISHYLVRIFTHALLPSRFPVLLSPHLRRVQLICCYIAYVIGRTVYCVARLWTFAWRFYSVCVYNGHHWGEEQPLAIRQWKL